MARSTTPIDQTAKPLLPIDLAKALTWLSPDELATLLGAVQTELKRRVVAAKPNDAPVDVRQSARDPMKPKIGQINAIRAALRAGVKPSTVAKQFGVSKTTVAEVASDASN